MDWFAHLFDFVLKLDCSNQTTFQYSVPSAVANGHEQEALLLLNHGRRVLGLVL